LQKLSQNVAQHVTHVQGHKVKYWKRNNSAADCSISLKFGAVFDHFTADTLQMSKINGSQDSCHRVKGQGHSVT